MLPALVLLSVLAQPAPAPAPTPEEIACKGAEALGGTPLEKAALCAGQAGHFAKARSWAERALVADRDSYRAQYLIGWIQHQGEGNLPKARFHLERASQLLKEAYGPGLVTQPVEARLALFWVFGEYLAVLSELDLHDKVLTSVEEATRRLGFDFSHLRAWRLMKLKRWDEARAAAMSAANAEEPWAQAMGRTALCGIESEQHHREAAYRTCLAATKPIRGAPGLCVELTNAGAAAEELYHFAEAERLFFRAAKEPPEGSASPWLRLVRLYTRQGRFAEAISGWREMMRYRQGREGYFDQQDDAETSLVGASILLLAGEPEEAERVTARALARPDRRGYTSGTQGQLTGAAAVLDMAAKRELAQSLRDAAAMEGLGGGLKLRARAARLSAQAALSKRRAIRILSDPERLVTSLRPEIGGQLELPTWMMPELISAVGPGVALAGIQAARAEETLEPALSEGLFSAYEAEAYWLKGDTEAAEAAAQRALEHMHPAEVALRARAAAIGGAAAIARGHRQKGLAWLREAAAVDPSLFRRLGLTIPLRVRSSGGGIAAAAAERLARVGRFSDAPDGFVIRLSPQGAQLLAPDGSLLSQARLRPARPGAPPPELRLSELALTRLFMPTLDLTQADVRSLDGSIDASQRAAEHLDDAMKGLLK